MWRHRQARGMNRNDVFNLLENQKAEDVAEKLIDNPDLIQALFTGISSTNPRIKFSSAKTLRAISEKKPRKLYPRMDFFVTLLDSKNTILKWIAIDIVANLATIDTRNEFSSVFEKFYSYLHEGSLITAGHVVDNSGKIALARPELRKRITQKLLEIEKVPLPTQECRNILIGKAIDAFDVYYKKIEGKGKLIEFARRQLNNSRNATKTRAARLLMKLETG